MDTRRYVVGGIVILFMLLSSCNGNSQESGFMPFVTPSPISTSLTAASTQFITFTATFTPPPFTAKSEGDLYCLITPLDALAFQTQLLIGEIVIVIGKSNMTQTWAEGKFALVRWESTSKDCWVESEKLEPQNFDWYSVGVVQMPLPNTPIPIQTSRPDSGNSEIPPSTTTSNPTNTTQPTDTPCKNCPSPKP